MAAGSFTIADPKSPDVRFYEAYTKALDGPLVLGVYEDAIAGGSASDLGYLAGIKARFGELPEVTYHAENGRVVEVTPRK